MASEKRSIREQQAVEANDKREREKGMAESL
jgi:hypothetical protein